MRRRICSRCEHAVRVSSVATGRAPEDERPDCEVAAVGRGCETGDDDADQYNDATITSRPRLRKDENVPDATPSGGQLATRAVAVRRLIQRLLATATRSVEDHGVLR